MQSLDRDIANYSLSTGDEVMTRHGWQLVQRIIAHPKGQHPDSPIRNDLDAVEIVTASGSRWTGSLSTPFIGSDLAMHWTWLARAEGMPGNREK